MRMEPMVTVNTDATSMLGWGRKHSSFRAAIQLHKRQGTERPILASGSQVRHLQAVSCAEGAPAKQLGQTEVRFEHLSVSADIIARDETQRTPVLPTIPNAIMTTLLRLSAKKHVIKKQILKDVSGVLRPGTMTLVLGQPGSGKSAFMKVLSGRFPMTSNVTVKETLEFAHACSGGLSKNGKQHLMSGAPIVNQTVRDAAHDSNTPDIVIHELGLENCQNTVVGDTTLRGVSGGERKRVTTGEMAFGNKYVLMMDEISTGLDSAATFDIISTQRSLAKAFGKTGAPEKDPLLW